MTAKRDAFGEICDLLRECGATLTLHGKPVTEAEVRAYAAGRVDSRLEQLTRKAVR